MTAYVGRVRQDYNYSTRYATPAQITYLEKLLTENDFYTGDYDRLWSLLEAHRVDLRTPGDGTRIPLDQASAAIDWVKRQIAKKAGPSWQEASLLTPTVLHDRQNAEAVTQTAYVERAKAAPTVVKYGIYQKDGQVYMVVPSKKNPDRVYAKVLVESAPRLTEAGEVVDFDWDFAPGVVWKLTEADRMTLADAGKLMVKYGKCLKCKKTLKAAKTMKTVEETGIAVGPTCRKYFA
jgi:hypothetical protein